MSFTIKQYKELATNYENTSIAIINVYEHVAAKRMTMKAGKVKIAELLESGFMAKGSAEAFAKSALNARTIKDFLASIDCCQIDTKRAAIATFKTASQFEREKSAAATELESRKVENPIKRHNHTLALGMIKLALAFDKYAIIDPLAWSATIREIRELTCYGMVQDSDRAVTRAEHYAILNRIQDSIIKELEYLK